MWGGEGEIESSGIEGAYRIHIHVLYMYMCIV